MKFLSIKKRLIMVLMITSLTSLVIATLAFTFYELQRYKKAKQAELVQISDLLAPQSRRYLMAGDVQQAEGWLAILAELRNVRGAALYDKQGNFFAGYQRAVRTLPALPRSIQDIPEISFTEATGTSLQRLYHQERLQGFFLVAVDLEDAGAGLLSLSVIFILVTLVTLAVAYVGAFLFYGQFKKPIVSLVDTARFICEKKDFKARAKKYSSDEMGLLTDTINSMLDEIAKREEGMHHLTEELESRVQTRTAALQEINARFSSEKTRADQAATVKSDFLANMSHEIRTPMNGIVAACDLAMEETLSPKVANYLQIIQDSSHDLLLIINDILDFSRLEAGTLILNPQLFSLPVLLGELNDFFSGKAHDQHVDLIIDTGSEVPALLVGDQVRFRQILYNLVDNGIKFSHNGMVSLYISCPHKNEKEAVLEIRVRDTGVGLSPAGKERIFSSFYQEDSSSTRQFGGTGLGLAISRRLTRMMGGTIEIESQLGKGSTFVVTVHLGWKESELAQAVASTAKNNKKAARAADLAGRHILVVEDDEINRGMVEAMLTGMGITVECVGNGQEAVDVTREGIFDALLMDMQMPVMGGYQAMEKIRKEGACKNVPIIAMTAHALPEDKEKCLQAGADIYISKPFHKTRLQEVLTAVLIPKTPAAAESGLDNRWEDLQTQAEIPPGLGLLDVAKAIRQLGVREDVYYRVLKTFCLDYQGFGEAYAQFAAENDINNIGKMIHSLKGSSATVGAHSLAQLAAEADIICKNNELPPPGMAEKLIACLTEVMACAAEVDKSEKERMFKSEQLFVQDPGKVQEQLQDLADSLDQSMYDMINICLERLEKNVSGKKMVTLNKMIRSYSYDQALLLVQEIAQELGFSLPR